MINVDTISFVENLINENEYTICEIVNHLLNDHHVKWAFKYVHRQVALQPVSLIRLLMQHLTSNEYRNTIIDILAFLQCAKIKIVLINNKLPHNKSFQYYHCVGDLASYTLLHDAKVNKTNFLIVFFRIQRMSHFLPEKERNELLLTIMKAIVQEKLRKEIPCQAYRLLHLPYNPL